MLTFSENIQNSGNYSLPPNIEIFSYAKCIYKYGLDMVRVCSLTLVRWNIQNMSLLLIIFFIIGNFIHIYNKL